MNMKRVVLVFVVFAVLVITASCVSSVKSAYIGICPIDQFVTIHIDSNKGWLKSGTSMKIIFPPAQCSKFLPTLYCTSTEGACVRLTEEETAELLNVLK